MPKMFNYNSLESLRNVFGGADIKYLTELSSI